MHYVFVLLSIIDVTDLGKSKTDVIHISEKPTHVAYKWAIQLMCIYVLGWWHSVGCDVSDYASCTSVTLKKRGL